MNHSNPPDDNNGDIDADREIERLLGSLVWRDPSPRLEKRMKALFESSNEPTVAIRPVSNVSTGRLSRLPQIAMAISLLAFGVFLGRWSVAIPTVAIQPEATPASRSSLVTQDTGLPLADVGDQLGHSEPPADVMSDHENRSQLLNVEMTTMPIVVDEQLLVIDGVPVKKLHLVSTEEVRVYDADAKRYETKLRSKSQFVLTPAPGA